MIEVNSKCKLHIYDRVNNDDVSWIPAVVKLVPMLGVGIHAERGVVSSIAGTEVIRYRVEIEAS